MERDYTAKMLASLEKQIESINHATMSPISDEVGDILINCGLAIDLIQSSNFLGGVKGYHKWVLDSHDTAINELEKIFEAVYKIDTQYAQKLTSITNATSEYVQLIEQLTKAISPNNVSGLSIKSIKDLEQRLAKRNLDLEEQINKTYDELLDEKEARMLLDAGISAAKGTLKLIKTVLSFMKNCAVLNLVGAALDLYDILDVVANDILANAVALSGGYLIAKTVGAIATASGADNFARNVEMTFIEFGTEHSGHESLTDTVIADHEKGKSKFDKAMTNTSIFIRDAKDAADVITSFNKLTDDVLDLESGEKGMGELVLGILGFSSGSSAESDIPSIQKAYKNYTIVKNVQRIVDLGISGAETYDVFGMGNGDNKLYKEVLKPLNLPSFVKKVNKMSEDWFNWPLLGN